MECIALGAEIHMYIPLSQNASLPILAPVIIIIVTLFENALECMYGNEKITHESYDSAHIKVLSDLV